MQYRGDAVAVGCACQNPPEVDGYVQKTVTLVHGTRARHAKWMQDGQPLPDMIRVRNTTALYRFCWRGRNRHGDRVHAAKLLREHLTQLVRAHPFATHDVVAHSHGGTVALYALRDERGGADASLALVRVATLATPFVFLRRRDLPTSMVVLLFFLWVLVIVFVIALLLGDFEPVGSDYLRLAMTVVICTFGTLSALALGLSAFLFSRVPELRLRHIANAELLSDARARTFALPRLSPQRVLVIRARGDEAAGLLGSAHFFSWIWTKTVSVFEGKAWWAIFGLYALSYGFQWGVDGLDELGWLRYTEAFEAARTLAFWIIVGSALFILISLSFLVSVVNLPFGVDTLHLTFDWQLSVESSPPGLAIALQVQDDESSQLAHSVYGEPEAIEAVLRWVSAP